MRKHFWKEYWKGKKKEADNWEHSRQAVEAPTTGVGQYFTKTKKKNQWVPNNDYKLHDVYAVPDFNKPYTADQKREAEAMQDKLSVSSEVTFTKTNSFTRLSALKEKEKRRDTFAAQDKYESGQNSVKGLHYLRFIGLEILSESAFTLSFHKFFSNEVKGLIRSVAEVKFSPDLRCWVIPLAQYE